MQYVLYFLPALIGSELFEKLPSFQRISSESDSNNLQYCKYDIAFKTVFMGVNTSVNFQDCKEICTVTRCMYGKTLYKAQNYQK